MKINLDPNRVFCTSDTHAFHKNICKGCSTWGGGTMRDYDDPVKMTEVMAERFNSVVGADDILIHNGDWSFGGKDKIKIFRDMLNCKNIILLKGNHDYNIVKDKDLQKLFWKFYGDYDVDPIVHFTIGGKRYVNSHYRLSVWDESHFGVRNLYGHSHQSYPDDPTMLSFDVGVDGFDLYPLDFAQIEVIMSTKTFKPVDHHRPENKS